jgi:hypothetical protein
MGFSPIPLPEWRQDLKIGGLSSPAIRRHSHASDCQAAGRGAQRLLQNDGSLTAWQQFTVKDPLTIAAGASLEISSADAGAVTFAGDSGTLRLVHRSSSRRTPELPPQWWHQFSVKSGRPGT